MAALKRTLLILTAFVAGNFVAVNILLAGKMLADFSNLYYYSRWEYAGGPLVGYLLLVLLGTAGNCLMVLLPTLAVLIFTETLKIRGRWFYMLAGGTGAFLLDVACTRFDLIGARSFCVKLTLGEVAIVSVAGIAAGYVFWRIAGSRAGDWRARVPRTPLVSV
ncbi:MAG: hypothetical protein P4M05_09540 [Bradyrhizobium sp.]|nr:hypothetical protein [Bradyrhizobium sp.]